MFQVLLFEAYISPSPSSMTTPMNPDPQEAMLAVSVGYHTTKIVYDLTPYSDYITRYQLTESPSP